MRELIKNRIAYLKYFLEKLDKEWEQLDSQGQVEQQIGIVKRVKDIELEIAQLEYLLNALDN